MLHIGQKNICKVLRFTEAGAYLEGDSTWPDFLVPNKYVPETVEIDDDLEVFVYFDSEGLIIGTTQDPLAQVGEFAMLAVTAIEEFGTFVDWGIDKDLFVPHREQLYKMEVGTKYPLYVYLDNSGRPAASTRINKFIDSSAPPYTRGDPVELLVYQETELGLRALVNMKYAGVLYRDDIINNIELGQSIKGYIKNVRSDHKIDLSLRPLESVNTNDLSQKILSQLQASGGQLSINAKTPAETINEMFGVSRKKFKVALGSLYKNQQIEIVEDGICLTRPSTEK